MLGSGNNQRKHLQSGFFISLCNSDVLAYCEKLRFVGFLEKLRSSLWGVEDLFNFLSYQWTTCLEM